MRLNSKGSISVVLMVAGLIGVLALGGVLFLLDIHYDNAEQRIRNLVADQERKIEANFDKMWKVISQQAQITDKYKDDFKEIYLGIMSGRYANGAGQMMLWIKEQNPNLDSDIYKKLMNTVEAERLSFEREQRRLSELAKEHKDLYTTKPAKWFVDGEPIIVKIISSTITKQVMESGRDDNVELFPGKKK